MSEMITIGVLSPVTGGFYYGKVVEGINREIESAGGRVVLIQTLDAGISSDEVNRAPDFSTRTAWDHIDGVISIATATQRGYLDRHLAAGRPVVLASDGIDGLLVPSVVPDNAGGIADAVDHLVEHGHTRIGFAANLIQSDMRSRLEGYRSSMLRHGIEPDPCWIIAASDNGELGGADVARRLIEAGMPVTALVVATDRNALGCLTTLTELGVEVPRDVAIVGFDGIDAGKYSTPTLSTVVQRFDELGAVAARLVVAQITGAARECRAHVTPATLVPRGSCGCRGVDGAGNVATAGGIDFWRSEAETHLERSMRRERLMREHYEIGIRLLDHEYANPRSLEWLAASDARGGCLALWDGDPSNGRMTVVGAYDPTGVLDGVVGATVSVEQFPPASVIELSDAYPGDITIVVPVKARGRDFGLLAIVGDVDTISANGRETHNEWAAMLTSALEQQSLQAELATSVERYSLWAVATNDGLWDWDLQTGTIYYSARCMQMLGHDARAVTASPSIWLDVIHPDDLDRMRTAMRTAPGSERAPVDLAHRIRAADGTYRRVSLRALPVGEPGEPAKRVVGSIHDIELRKRLEDQLRRAAHYDEVTGLPNRKLFLERLAEAIERAQRSPDRTYAVIFFDLDGFKAVNDTLGHLAGDLLLAETGRRLREGLRGHDLAARFGGDEFAVLLHGLEPTEIPPIVDRMQAVLGASMELLGTEVKVSASAGIATSRGDYVTAEAVLRDADTAMYHAKSRHRGSASLFDTDERTSVTAADTTAAVWRAALQG